MPKLNHNQRNEHLSNADILVILQAADEIINTGGRTLLSLILKGSRDKRVLSRGLDNCPSYGYYREQSQEDIIEKIDWMIHHDFLKVEIIDKLPLISFTERGWAIERAQLVELFLLEWDLWLSQGKTEVDMNYLKDRNRGMILLFLSRVKESGDAKYISYLKQWAKIDYKKVQAAIKETINSLEQGASHISTDGNINSHNEVIEALKVPQLEPERLICWDCGKRFIFEVEEQKFFQLKGFERPKRCLACRERKWLNRMGIDPDF